MKNTQPTYDLKVEKTIAKSPAEVFKAIGEGRLFMSCSANSENIQVDFQIGGKYLVEFKAHGMKNTGEFLEIIPNQKIVFTWCQDYNNDPTPDTQVVIELKEVGGKTAVTILHTGFHDADNRDGHTGGWTSGLTDLGEEITEGRLSMHRKASISMEKLFQLCKTDLKGETIETVPNQKMVMNLKGTKVTLLFDTDDEDQNASWLEIHQEGLNTEAQQKAQRKEWDHFTNTAK